MGMASNIGNLLGQQGAAQAGGVLGQQTAQDQALGGVASSLGQVPWSNLFKGGF